MINITRVVCGMNGTNCYIVVDDRKNCVLIDCEGDGENFESYFEKESIKPSYIILTHGHSDHIGAVNYIKNKYNCKVCASEFEKELLENPNLNLSKFMCEIPISVKADIFLKDNENFNFGDISFKIMNTPGHTKGSICLIMKDKIFSGDTLFEGSCGRVDFPTGDAKEIMKSLENLSKLEGDYEVYPGHGPSTTLEYERTYNPYINS